MPLHSENSELPADRVPRGRAGIRGFAFALFAVMGLALGVRALLVPEVFGEDRLYFDRADSQYHLRRAYYTYREFPAVLMSDPYVNHPGGAPIPWPPLYDLVLGSAARLLASDDRGFERVVVWANPLIAALACLPIFLAGRRLGGPRLGLGAASIYALLPVGVMYSRVGDVDHHALVAMLGACLLALALRAVDTRESQGAGRLDLKLATLLALARAAMMLTWHGSLLYVVLLEGTILLAALAQHRRDLFETECASLVGTAALLAPVIVASPVPLGGAFSAIALSWLHVLLLGSAAVSAGFMSWTSARSDRSGLERTLLFAVACAAPILLLGAIPGVRAGLEPALQFLTMSDAMGMQTAEQRPLLPIAAVDREVAFPTRLSFGFFAYALPVLPLWLAWYFRRAQPATKTASDASDRGVGLALALWSGFFVALAVPQYRYANDLGPSIAVVFAFGVARSSAWARAKCRAPGVFGPVFGAGLALWMLAPPITDLYLPWMQKANRWARTEPGAAGAPVRDRLADRVNRSLTLFLEEVRRATPETRGFLDPTHTPEYGIVADADIGHAIQYIARRPTPTDPFWSYIGERNWANAHALLTSSDEARALELADRLAARYVVTVGRGEPGTLVQRLHAWDGSAAGTWAALGHFRLVTEGPAGGSGLPGSGQRRVNAPYKLFEIVAGAEVEVATEAGAELRARAFIETPTGRRFPYRTSSIAGRDGVAVLRLPYATEASNPTVTEAAATGPPVVAGAEESLSAATRISHTETSGAAVRARTDGLWTLRSRGRSARIAITEAQVREGTRIRLAAAALQESSTDSGDD